MSTLNNFQVQVAEIAIEQLFIKPYFSICDFDKIVDLIGVKVDKKDRQTLYCLHCVDWKDMPESLRILIKEKIREMLIIPLMEKTEGDKVNKFCFAFWR